MLVWPPHKWALWAAGVAGLSLVLSWAWFPGPTPRDPAQPKTHQSQGYVGSAECKACHPGAYASWSHTYHKTMTRSAEFLLQEPSEGPTFPVSLDLDGATFELRIQDRKVTVQGPDLHRIAADLAQIRATPAASDAWKRRKAASAWSNAPEVTRSIVLVTGSHHYLAFWVGGGPGSALRQFPHVYFLDERRWIPRREAFLQPPHALPYIANFNANCIQCHTVAGRPRQSEGTDVTTGIFWEHYASDTADLGIACEACHGPGQQHVEHFRSPWARYRVGLTAQPPGPRQAHDMFVADADHAELANAACGQCHSYFVPQNPDQWWDTGFSAAFKAGDVLTPSRTVLRASSTDQSSALALVSAEQHSLFWSDGSIMVGGREYNGLTQSPCFTHGRSQQMISCVSCHSMHQGTRSGQIAHKWGDNQANAMCSQCHTVSPTHSRHQPDSPGALCVNCHMPKTSYALLSATRSHQITSPAPITREEHRSPQACALCHTDRPLDWLNRELGQFSSSGASQASPTQAPTEDLPWALDQVLTGHAATRAIFVAALSSPESRDTAGDAPFAAVKETLLRDEYAAVAHMARRAQARLAGTVAGRVPRAAAAFRPPSAQELRALEHKRDRRPIIVSE